MRHSIALWISRNRYPILAAGILLVDLLPFFISFYLPYILAIILRGLTLLGASAGLIGCFAVLRRRALTGDALAHATLPGICVGFMVLGRSNTTAMLIGALVSGLLGIAVISALRRWTRVNADAAICIVLGVFFGAGEVLRRIILDPSKFPGGGRAGIRSYIFGMTATMNDDDLFWITVLFIATLTAMIFLYKEFKLIAFDIGFAHSQGWPVIVLDLLLMGLIAVAVVVGLPAVGVVMIAALLIIPAAAARFWTERLNLMLLLSATFGIYSGVVGAWVSSEYARMPAGPTIILASVVIFLLSAIIAPKRGLIARKRFNQRMFWEGAARSESCPTGESA